MQLICATGNADKFGIGQKVLKQYDIDLVRHSLDIDEIQGEEPRWVVKDKAQKAFEQLGQPVAVTDDWWDIPALGGFPGPYMKSINQWFAPEDLIALMAGKTDRRAILHYYVGYYDGKDFQLFSGDFVGRIIEEPRGNYGTCTMKVTTMDGDDGRTISEIYDAGAQHAPNRLEPLGSAWRALGQFLEEKHI